jgi:hypothetical protein
MMTGITLGLLLTLAQAQGIDPPKDHPNLRAALVVSLTTLAAIDVGQTAGCVHWHTCQEANPLYKGAADSPVQIAVLKGALVGGIIGGAWQARRTGHRKLSWVLLGVGVGSQAVAVWSNARVLNGAGR